MKRCPHCGNKTIGSQETLGSHRKCTKCGRMTCGKHDEPTTFAVPVIIHYGNRAGAGTRRAHKLDRVARSVAGAIPASPTNLGEELEA